MMVGLNRLAPEPAILGSAHVRDDELPSGFAVPLASRDDLAQIIAHRFPIRDLARAVESSMAGAIGQVVAGRFEFLSLRTSMRCMSSRWQR